MGGMLTDALATRYEVTLPDWVLAELAALPDELATLEERMRVAVRLAELNFRSGGGGPFAALVVERDTGRLVSVGVNRTLACGLSSAHAEVVALGLAQVRRGTWDLGAADAPATQVVVSARPCVQCFGALLWSGVTSLVIPDDGPALEAITGFDEGPMPPDWQAELADRGIEVVVGVGRGDALAVFRAYADAVGRGETVLYNARGAGRHL